MRRLRTFIALDLGKQVRDRTIALQESLARSGTEVKWVEPDNLHVTLLFLGEVDDREVPAVCRAVAEACRERAPFLPWAATAARIASSRRTSPSAASGETTRPAT
jgi:2'-5' RNA ligase